jgi:hypothetical protein
MQRGASSPTRRLTDVVRPIFRCGLPILGRGGFLFSRKERRLPYLRPRCVVPVVVSPFLNFRMETPYFVARQSAALAPVVIVPSMALPLTVPVY